MASFLNSVMTVAAVQLQLPCVQLVTERHRLLGFMPNIDNRRMDSGEQAGCQITGNTCSSKNQHDGEFVDPRGEMELLHNVHSFAVGRGPSALLDKVVNNFGTIEAKATAQISHARSTRIPRISALIDMIKSRT